jgi:EAL domain-containing protein (putative c-di-GMP-specific phosphodiesterase class I)
MPGAAAAIARALDAAEVDPAALTVELTESVPVHDLPALRAELVPLRALGVRIALDDFGTGFNSLVTLVGLEADVVKIDRSFVAAPAGSEYLVRGVVKLARRYGMRTVAEGVETPAQLDQLRAAGCDEAQGYLFARPMDATDASAWLLARGALACAESAA